MDYSINQVVGIFQFFLPTYFFHLFADNYHEPESNAFGITLILFLFNNEPEKNEIKRILILFLYNVNNK